VALVKEDRSLKAVYVADLDGLMKKMAQVDPDTQNLLKNWPRVLYPLRSFQAGEILSLTTLAIGGGLLIKPTEAALMAKQINQDGNGHKRMQSPAYKSQVQRSKYKESKVSSIQSQL